MNVITGEPKPTGAKLEIPEEGVNITCDSSNLAIAQELPIGDQSYFINLCVDFAELVATHFQPREIISNGFAWKSYSSYSSVQEMLSASLKLGDDFQTDLGKVLGMIPDHKKLDYTLASGSKEMHVLVEPVTFERLNLPRRNASFRSTKGEKSRVDRLNQFADRI